jgi:4-hydroxybenzoate polyprenyltransferase
MYKDFISQVELNLNIPLYFAAGFGLFAFLSNLMREIVKDMEDFVGDMETGGQTVPIRLGYTTTKNIVHAINVLTITLLIYVSWKLFNLYQDKISVIYLSLTTIIPLIIFSFILFKSDSTKKFKRAGMFLKFVMLFGILYSLIIWYNCSKA